MTVIPESFIAEFMAHRHFHAAKTIDIIARKDGKEYHIEGDWLKPFIASLATPRPSSNTIGGELDAVALEAAGAAFRATNYQGFLYGNRHVIRDINAKGTPEVWSLTTDEYDVGHAAMEIECDRLEMQAAIRAYLSALQGGVEK